MDPALKKRLIGAGVLIIVAIIFLPMLFDGSAPATGDVQPIEVPLPPERDFSTRLLTLDAPATPGAVAAAVGLPTDAASPPSTDTTMAASDDTVATVDAPVTVRADALPEDFVAVPPAPVVAAAATTPSAAAQTSSTTPKPLLDRTATTAAPTTPVVASAGRFMVNLGSYASAANAAQLVSSLKAAGLVVRSESVSADGKPVSRLQLGPFPTRTQAENARLKAKAVRADLPLQVTEVDDSPSADVAVPNPSRSGVAAFAVQVAVLGDIAKANASRDQLRAAGFAAFVEKLQTDKGTVYRLRVGPEAARSDAEKIVAGIKQRFGMAAIIVAYP